MTKWMLNQNGYMYGLPLNPFEVKYYRKCIEQGGKGVIYPLVKINVMCIEDTTAQLIRQVKSLNIIPIEEAMSRNNLDSSQMHESIKRGEYRAFKKDGRLYVTDAREKGMSFGVELIDLFE